MFTEVSDIKKTNLHKLSNQNELFFLFLHVSLSFTTTWLTLILTQVFFLLSQTSSRRSLWLHTNISLEEDSPTWTMWTLYDPVWLGAGRTPSPSTLSHGKEAGKGKKIASLNCEWWVAAMGDIPPPLFLSPPLSNCFHCLSFFFSFALILFSLAFFTSLSIPQPL